MERLERLLQRFARLNPCVAVHEMRMRMRGARPFLLILGYAVIGVAAVMITFVVTELARSAMTSGGYSPQHASESGRSAFIVLSYAQLSLILFMLPAFSAGAITMEREKRTLEMLRATMLSAHDVISGKLLVTLAFAAILLLTTLPIAAWCVLLGGVSLREVFFVYTYLFAVAAAVSALGFWISTLFQRSLGAIGAVYFVLILLLGGFTALYAFLAEALRSAYNDGSGSVLVLMLVWAIVIGTAFYVITVPLSRRIASKRQRKWTSVALLVVAIGLFALLNVPISRLLEAAVGTPEAPLIVHPVVGLTAMLFADIVNELLHNAGGGGPTHADAQPYVWAGLMLLYLLVAVVLWFMSISSFRVRAR